MARRMAWIGLGILLCAQVVAAQAVEDDETAARSRNQTSAASERAGPNIWSDAGWGVLAAAANVFYMPAKIVYAGLGIVTGGLAYVLTVGDADAAQKVWSPSVGGSYVITPAMLRCDEPILFNGQSYSTD